MRVALVAALVSPIREPQLGGAQAFMADLARGLLERGHEVDVYAASGSQLEGVHFIDTGVDHRALAATRYRAGGRAADEDFAEAAGAAESAFAGVYSAIREGCYDIVHNHAFDAPAVTHATALAAPVLHTLHLPPAVEVERAIKGAACNDRRPALACVSESQARAWRRLRPVDAILPPNVPTRSIPFALGAGRGAVFAGRLSAEKGAAEAIEIARAAGIPLDLYGDAYDDGYVRDRVEPRLRDAGVTLHPAVPRRQLWAAMARAAVVLFPARWDEPFGMVAAEAQACGTPVVAFRRGALAEVIADGATGFLIAPDDVAAAAAAVARAPALSRARCRAHAETDLDIEDSLDAHEQLYARLTRAAAQAGVGG